MGEQELDFDSIKGKQGVWTWNKSLSKTFSMPVRYKYELPDIFVYLIKNKQRVCFIRKNYKCYSESFNSEPELLEFTADMAESDQLRADQAGYIKIKLFCGEFNN